MKEYPNRNERKQESVQQKLNALKLFQSILRESEAMNHGNAQAIADGLESWIDALELTLMNGRRSANNF